MNKKTIIVLIALILIVSFSGCTETKATETKDNKKKEDVSSEETIKEILEKAKNIKSIEYETTMEVNDTAFPMTMKIYQKEKKYRIEVSVMGQNSIGIFDGTNAYSYDTKKDVYYLMKENKNADSKPIDFIDIAEQALSDSSLKETGKEIINGLNTRIIEFNYLPNTETQIKKTKAWISEKYGIPVKMEAEGTFEDTKMKSTITLNNIKINSVDDSMFIVPEDKIKPYEINWEEA